MLGVEVAAEQAVTECPAEERVSGMVESGSKINVRGERKRKE